MQISREPAELGFGGLWWCIQQSQNGRIKPKKIPNLTLLVSIYPTLFYIFYQLPASVLSVLVNKPLGDGQSVFLAHQAPSHHVKKHIENIV